MIILISFKYSIAMYPMSINSISLLHTSCMIPRKMDPVKANPYNKLFYLSIGPAATMMRRQYSPHFVKQKRLQRFVFHLHFLIRFIPFVFIHISVLLWHIFMFFFCFFSYSFCFSCTLHLHVCVDYKSGVSS